MFIMGKIIYEDSKATFISGFFFVLISKNYTLIRNTYCDAFENAFTLENPLDYHILNDIIQLLKYEFI